MPNDFYGNFFGSDDEYEEAQQYDAGELQPLWNDMLEKTRFFYDYRRDAQDTLFYEFMDQFSRGGSRHGMELWLLKMGIEDFEFNWALWKEVNGY